MSKFPKDADILPPSDDRIFKTLLTHPNAKQVLIDIVSTVIERKVIDVQLRNNEIPPMNTEEKNERFDVNCTIDTGDQIDVEMHSCPQHESSVGHSNFINKYVYFLTDLHSSQKSIGIKYRDLVKTYQVTFCMYTVLPHLPNYVNRFSLMTRNGVQLTDQINMVIIELSKINEMLKKPVNKMTSFEMWSLFLRFASDPVHRNLINDIINRKEEIDMAASLLQEVTQEEREKAIARSRRMYEMDRVSDLLTAEENGEIRGLAAGMQQGIQQGLQQGIMQGHEQVLSLLEQGLSLEEIKQRLKEKSL